MGSQFFVWSGMWIFPVIGIIVMLFVFYMVFSRGRFSGCSSSYDYNRNFKDDKNSESALDILNKRYVNSEISKEDFERMKKDIIS
ncbi:SHOCT domain-containing protein [Helicovermis profundi]|uniref:SHOCT domain-containing protein n=1 Tax=Helicovermis profundi TaxID=3065157 RepID=A0AAU9EMB2_9FIRM|nr:hypothetical protein HLPR_15650 [Clostridia bacterium S502]